MVAKRMRVFAGPNGSGKTTIFKEILAENKIHLGTFVNADEIELELKKTHQLNFSKFNLSIKENNLQAFIQSSTFSPLKRNEPDLYSKLFVSENILTPKAYIDSYLAADIAEFIRQQLLTNEVSFTYETVMSHKDKIQFLKKAKEHGYRVYLYFIGTNDPDINIRRVNIRVAQAGHDVKPEITKSRYYKSLANLKDAIKQSDRAYIFDTSNEKARFIAEITDGSEVIMNTAIATPSWVKEYLGN